MESARWQPRDRPVWGVSAYGVSLPFWFRCWQVLLGSRSAGVALLPD
jgi:hypothetical protein